MKPFLRDFIDYLKFFQQYFNLRFSRFFHRFEFQKNKLVDGLTSQRGRWARPFAHSGVVGLVFLGITIGPAVVAQVREVQPASVMAEEGIGGAILGVSASSLAETVSTQISEKPRADIIQYQIQEGDTVSKISEKFGVSEDTIYWENNITAKTRLKTAETLRILPVSGVKHTVSRGETVNNIADKYDISAQAIVDWPFNTFTNDETFALAVGQILIIPDGVKPDEIPVNPRQYLARQTPAAGSAAAAGSGNWVWPAQGRLTQYFVWYHPALDIANRDGPAVVAADSGKVILVSAGRVGYGNHIIVDHGNGFSTLYAHLSGFNVSQGQNVGKGTVLGSMGSTGRSTGTHLHFEIRLNGIAQNPLSYLK